MLGIRLYSAMKQGWSILVSYNLSEANVDRTKEKNLSVESTQS